MTGDDMNNLPRLTCYLIFAAFFNPSANALDLYVDNDTQQIYAAPGHNRTRLGTFEKKEEIEKLRASLKAEIEKELQLKEKHPSNNALTENQAVASVQNILTEEEMAKNRTAPPKNKANTPATTSYGKNGFEFRTDNDKFSLAIQNRLQARYA